MINYQKVNESRRYNDQEPRLRPTGSNEVVILQHIAKLFEYTLLQHLKGENTRQIRISSPN